MEQNSLMLAAGPKRNFNSVNLHKLKTYVFDAFPERSLLRELVLAELDELDAREFIGKVGTWLRVFDKNTHEK